MAQRISIAMCTYEMAAFIGPQLESFARQTRLPDELVVCDDGSLDGTLAILAAFAARAPFPVRIVRNPIRLGVTANFEHAISLCQGDIIFLSDHDDVWHPQKIEWLFDLMRDEKVLAAFGDATVVSADLVPLGFTLWESCLFTPERQRRFAGGEEFAVLLSGNVMQGAALAFRSSLRPLVLPLATDWPHDYWIGLITAAQGRIAFTERCVLDYRQHGGNLIGAGPPPIPTVTPITAPMSWWRATAMRWQRRFDRWSRVLRSPRRYYGERLARLEKELAPLDALQRGLARLAPSDAAQAAQAELANVTRFRQERRAMLREKFRRWGGVVAE